VTGAVPVAEVTAGLAGAMAAAALHGARPVPRHAGARPSQPARSVVVVLGTWVRRRAGLAPEPRADRVAGWVGLGALPAALVAPWAVPTLAVAWWTWEVLRRRRAAAGRAADVIDEVPDVVDLLRLATGSGLALPLAVPVVARHGSGPVRAALQAASAAAGGGRPLAEALVECLGPVGSGPARLGHALAGHLRYGSPLDPALARLGIEVRAERRRHAEVLARKVPVRLLLPLVVCVLPAFGLLTVVPLLAGSLQGLLG
jgi:tight adherence protein C